MANQDRKDRQAVIDSIRNKQKGAETRRGLMIVGVCVLAALLIVAAAAWKPLSDWWTLRSYADAPLSDIGAKADACEKITTKKATGNQQHVEEGTPLEIKHSPPAFGEHYNIWEGIERKVYTAEDRPVLGKLIHNLEHGYTILWYDETAANDDAMMDDIRGIATKLEGTTNYRDKFKAAPWTKADGKGFPDGQHIALTHWSIGGAGETDQSKQVGVWQYCSAPSGEALETFMDKYPYFDSPEPDAI